MKFLAGCLLLMPSLLVAGDLILKDVNVIDVRNLKVIKAQTIWIKDQNIEAVVDSKNARKLIPKNAPTLELAGQYVMPGMIDTHVHHAIYPEQHDYPARVKTYYQLYLRSGVTSVRDMGGDGRVLANRQRSTLLNQLQAPEVYFSSLVAGPEFFSDPRIASATKGVVPGQVPWMKSITIDSNWQDVISQAKGLGSTGIKIYRNLPKEVLPPLVAEAKKQGVMAWSHTYIETATPLDAIEAGIQVVSHADGISGINQQGVIDWLEANGSEGDWRELLDDEEIDQVLELMRNNGVVLDATLAVFEQRGKLFELMETRYKMAKAITQMAHKKGVKISTGTDIQVLDFATERLKIFDELELLIEDVGMSPIEAIQAATYHGAMALGLASTHGEIKSGKVANLVIYEHDPTTGVAALQSASHVLKQGQLVYRGAPEGVPFSSARISGKQLWMSGQIGNLPGTKVLAGADLATQMNQTMENIRQILLEHRLGFEDVFKCTMMLANIDDWQEASEIYQQHFILQLPARSAFATNGLALGAKVELECMANLSH